MSEDRPLPEPAEVLCPNCEASLFLTLDRQSRYCLNCEYREPHHEPATQGADHG